MKPRRSLLLVAVLLCGVALKAPALPVTPFNAVFGVYYRGLPIGEGRIKLIETVAGGYEISSLAESTGLAAVFYPYKIVGRSTGRFVDGIPHPDSYQQFHAVSGEEHVAIAKFNWDRKKVMANFDDRKRRLRLRHRVVDPLSLFALAIVDLQNGHTARNYRLINRVFVSTYRVTNHGSETLHTPLGKLTAERISRQRKGSAKRTTLWFATELNYLPVQVIYEEDGQEKIRLTVRANDQSLSNRIAGIEQHLKAPRRLTP